MTPYVHYYAVNLRDGMRLERERHPVAQGDALADRFVVTVMDGTTPVDLTGVGVSAMVIRADGVSVPVTGQVEDGSAVVTLTDECYDVSGCITITVTIESGEIRQSVLQVILNVATSETDIVADTDVLHFADVLAAAERAEAAADRAEAAGGGSGGGGGIITETDPTVPDWAKQPDPPTYTAEKVGADPTGTAYSTVAAHNADEEAHPAIREAMTELADRLNALADSDDTTLDQLSEIVAYIKSNKSLIDGITTGKVSVSDIVNNLTSTATNKPLSAAQGKALKTLIDAIVVPTKLSDLTGDATHRLVTDAEKAEWNAKSTFSGAYADLTGKPTIPTKVSQLTNDAGYLTEHQDISGLLPRTELDTAIDTALAEAKASGEFDGADGEDARIIAQDTPPDDTSALWVDTSDDSHAVEGSIILPNPLYGKRVAFNGTSICAGNADFGSEGGYGKIIAERNNMIYQNIAQGGATITAELYSSSTGKPYHWISRSISDMDADADYAIVEGGVNDYWKPAPLGAITSGYAATLDDTTFYGAFESMCKQLITRYAGKKVGYIIVHPTGAGGMKPGRDYYNAAVACCEKWGVPYIDLSKTVPPLGYVDGLYGIYTRPDDVTHPSLLGYQKYYCDKIEAWMRTL